MENTVEIQALLNSATNWVLTMYPAHHSAYQSQDWLQHRLLLTEKQTNSNHKLQALLRSACVRGLYQLKVNRG